MFDSLLDEDATTLAAMIRSGEVSASELTQAALARMARREPDIQAFCTPTPDRALAQAKALDARRARGETLGALAGVWSYFLEWLSLLGIVVPPFGAVMIVDLIFMAKISEQRPSQRFRSTAFAAWAIGSLCAVIAHLAFPQFGEVVIGLVTAALSYSLISRARAPQPVMENKNA